MLRRVAILVISSVLVTLMGVGVFSYRAVHQSIGHTFADHLRLASVLARNIDFILEGNITRLHDVGVSGRVDFDDGDWAPEKRALRTAYEYSIFSDGVFIVDRLGTVMLRHPHKSDEMGNMLDVPAVQRALTEGHTAISDVYTMPLTGRRVIFMVVPLRGVDGAVMGAVGGEVDPTSYLFSQMFRSIPAGDETGIELWDRHGVVISSNRADRILDVSNHDRIVARLMTERKSVVVTCHRCHVSSVAEVIGAPPAERQSDVLAFVPLELAPWAITVREPESEVYAPVYRLLKSVAVVSVIFVVTGLLLAVGLTKGIVNPIQALTGAARRMAQGDLSALTLPVRDDEVGELTHAFEVMRGRLSESLERMASYSGELERQVRARTRELELRKRQLDHLLSEIVHAQEEERKRIARELHDETSQSMAALGMSIEIAGHALTEGVLTEEMVSELRRRVETLIDGIGRIIKDLRPPVLDDLGLVAGVRWFLDRHLPERGIRYFIDAEGVEEVSMSKWVQLSCFRVVQEAVTNACRHAAPRNVFVAMARGRDAFRIEVVDDGAGFDAGAMDASPASWAEPHRRGGVGLMGMRERIEQLGGTLTLTSAPGEGTTVAVSLPLQSLALEVGRG